jgi:hypothetical protein
MKHLSKIKSTVSRLREQWDDAAAFVDRLIDHYAGPRGHGRHRAVFA